MTIDVSTYKTLYLETARKLIREYEQIKSSEEVEYAVEGLLRVFHSLKGQSMAMGYKNIAQLSLQGEMLCRELSENRVPLNAELRKKLPSTEIFYQAIDAIEKTNIELPLTQEIESVQKSLEDIKKDHLRVLVVEDDQFFQKICVNKLREKSVLVDFANDGEDGIARLAAKKYDCVLLDIIMPKKNGFDVLQFARDTNLIPHTAFIVFSTLGEEDNLQKALAAGAVDFINKGDFDFDKLMIKIASAVSKNKL